MADRYRRNTVLIACALAAACIAPALHAQNGEPSGATSRSARRDPSALAAECRKRGARFLLATQDREGAWMPQAGPGITCLALKALIQEPSIGPDHPAVRRGIQFVMRSQHDDGGFYSPEGIIKNYETSVALSMFAAANRPQYAETIRRAQQFLTDLQWDEGEDISVDNVWYGGAGYGNGKRPDLSNTQMMIEALKDSGLPKDHAAYKKALVFISRCQMLGESNDQPFAKGSTQGGFIYSPANGGESKAGIIEIDGRAELRTYGSMTYAGFKSMLYVGLTRDDPRVKAAVDWIGRHWTLDYNPNMPAQQSRQGLYYYYHVFARALDALGEDRITDALGREHDWRAELVEKLHELQQADGSWVNDEDRWMEGVPALTTAYSLLALQAAFGDASQSE
ncbi:MAG: hypothetical protein D6744_14780 [Planctomycetota bacterium]|nr:MAG: hypothetical protein D6744_14780 [Planctomycetota bacterium]